MKKFLKEERFYLLLPILAIGAALLFRVIVTWEGEELPFVYTLF